MAIRLLTVPLSFSVVSAMKKKVFLYRRPLFNWSSETSYMYAYFDLWPRVCGWLCVQMQGAGTKSWNRLSSLFNKDDEHQLLEETESPPVADQWVEMFLFLVGCLMFVHLAPSVGFVWGERKGRSMELWDIFIVSVYSDHSFNSVSDQIGVLIVQHFKEIINK